MRAQKKSVFNPNPQTTKNIAKCQAECKKWIASNHNQDKDWQRGEKNRIEEKRKQNLKKGPTISIIFRLNRLRKKTENFFFVREKINFVFLCSFGCRCTSQKWWKMEFHRPDGIANWLCPWFSSQNFSILDANSNKLIGWVSQLEILKFQLAKNTTNIFF